MRTEKQTVTAFRLGLFIILGLLLFSVGIFWIGKQQFLFQSTYRLTADFPNAAGLIEGSAVRVAGIHRGTVKEVDLPGGLDQGVRIVMSMTDATHSVIRKDSTATINSEGLLGDKYVEISVGTKDAPGVKDGDSILSKPAVQMSDLLDKTNGILDTAKSSVENLDSTLDNFKQISAKVNQGQGTAGALINDKQLYQNMNAGVSAMREDMEALKHNFLLRGFFKDRGYESGTELSKNEISKLPSRPPLRTFVYDGEKLFDKPATAKLKREKLLNDAGQFLEQTPFGLVVIAAYTDMKGDTEKDRTLTQARAVVARDYLIHNFKIDDKRVKTIGVGKSDEIGGTSQLQILVFAPAK
jgi:phospholipid/cholesterol/gamma-HCH transport system substrate-binding protein